MATLALHRARRLLLGLQHEDGHWQGRMFTNVAMEAEDILVRMFIGGIAPEHSHATARWIRSQQCASGGWPTFYGGPGDLSISIEAWIALRLAGDSEDAPHMTSAASFIRENGGVSNARVFTRIWLALYRLENWESLPILPPEIMLLPSWFPLSLANWGCWARQTIVPMAIVMHAKPSRTIPFSVDCLRAPEDRSKPSTTLFSWSGAFRAIDTALHWLDILPSFNPLRAYSLKLAEKWMLDRQEADGSFGGIQAPSVYSLLAFHVLGYKHDHPTFLAALAGIDSLVVRDRDIRRIEACRSPCWDTCLAMTALADSGAITGEEKVFNRATKWLLDREVSKRGDWAVRRPGLSSGGWAFENANQNYPDTDDTAEVIISLRHFLSAHPQPVDVDIESAVDRAIRWIVGMQCISGGWAAFDADQTGTLPGKLPFCDFGLVTDPPSADVTAHVIEMLARERSPSLAHAIERGVQFLLETQEKDGSWYGRWGCNYIYGTGAAIPALIEAGILASSLEIATAIRWLVDHQDASGGFGEDQRSYADPAVWSGKGQPTPSQTAWALFALLAYANASDDKSDLGGVEHAIMKAVGWLVDNQREDGGWDEEPFTGTGFPNDFSLRYELYALYFPISALGRYVRRQERLKDA